MLPKGWERKALEKVSEIKTGAAKGKKGLKDPIEVPYLRVANVQDGHIDLSEVKTIQIERHQLERYSLQRGDVLMTEGGDFDKLGRGDVWQGQIEPCLNQNHVFAVRVDKNLLIPYFLAALSGSHYGKTYFLSCAKRSTNLASINSTQLKEFPVIIPPFPEQQKIVKILSTWDNAITTTEKLIANSKQQKKALMQQLLTGKKRLVNPETGKAFNGKWLKKTIGAIAKTAAGATPSTKKPEYWDGNIPWMSSGEINLKQVYSVKKRITELGFSKSSTKIIPKKSILIALAGQGKTRGTVAVNHIELCTNQSIAAILLNKEIADNNFIYFNLDSRYTELRAMSTGDGGRGGLNLSIINSVPLSIPEIKEQKCIARVLVAADKEIELLEAKLAHFKQEKKALMQQLLTGKRRVKIAA